MKFALGSTSQAACMERKGLAAAAAAPGPRKQGLLRVRPQRPNNQQQQQQQQQQQWFSATQHRTVCAAAAATPPAAAAAAADAADAAAESSHQAAEQQQQQQYQQQQYQQQQYQQHPQQQQQQQQQDEGWQRFPPRQQHHSSHHQQQQRLRQQQLPLPQRHQPRQQQQQQLGLPQQQNQQQQRRPSHQHNQQQQHHHPQQQQQQQQQQQRSVSMLLDPQQQHHASVLANAWGESDRRAALAALVRSADTVDSLAAVWLTCRSSAGAAELAVLFNRLANVCEPKVMSVKGLSTAKVLLRELLIASEDKMSVMAGPEFVYIIASLAKLRASPDVPWINRWLAMSRHRLGRLSAQQMVMCVRALGRLDVKTADIHTCIAFPAWMHNYTASLGPRLSDLSGFELVKLMLGFSMLSYKPSWSFLNQVALAVETKLSGLDTVHLTCLLSSWSTLKFEPEPSVMRSVMGEVYTKLPLFDDKDLTTALTAFCSMRRMLRADVLADFVAQVSSKMDTFSPRELAGVLVALGQLGYKPGPEWFAQATQCFRGKLQSASGSTFALVAQGLASSGYDPEPWLVNELVAASSPKLPRMEVGDLLTLANAVSRFSYRPDPASAAFRPWQRWWERLGYVVGRTSLVTKQAMVFLEAMCDAGMVPDPATTDHLVLQMVSNGLNKAPVGRVTRLLELLRMTQQQAGGQLINHYANTLRLVCSQLGADQFASAMRALALESFVPQSWWVVNMLAAAHIRCDEFDGPAAAELLWAVAKLCQGIQLPSDKWVQDFGGSYWAAVAALGAQGGGVPLPSAAAAAAGGAAAAAGTTAAAAAAGASADAARRGGNGRPNRYVQQRAPAWAGASAAGGSGSGSSGGGGGLKPGMQGLPRTLTAQQLGLGLWGAVTVGFKPTEAQWVQWEAAASALGWDLLLDGVQAAVLGFKAAGRTLPRELSQQLQAEKARAQSEAHAAVEEAAAAKAAAARQLAMQQERMRQAAAAAAAFQQQRQQQQVEGQMAWTGGGGGGAAAAGR